MPVLEDPENVLPDKKKKPTASQIIAVLLYPVVFAVGLSVGIVIGLKQGAVAADKNANANAALSNARIIPNVNAAANQNLNQNANTNASAATLNLNASLLNTNSALKGGDYVKLDPQVETALNQAKQRDLATLVDQSLSLTDVLRQQDLISLKYNLKTYYAVNNVYPTTNSVQIHLDQSPADVFYVAMKDFYGGSFYEKIDPQSPQYYYGYTSDGQSFELTAYLTTKKKAFILTDSE